MNQLSLDRVTKAIHLKGFPAPLTVQRSWNVTEVALESQLLGRPTDDPTRIRIWFSPKLPPQAADPYRADSRSMTSEEVKTYLKEVRAKALELLMHELDESLVFGDERPFDPHNTAEDNDTRLDRAIRRVTGQVHEDIWPGLEMMLGRIYPSAEECRAASRVWYKELAALAERNAVNHLVGRPQEKPAIPRMIRMNYTITDDVESDPEAGAKAIRKVADRLTQSAMAAVSAAAATGKSMEALAGMDNSMWVSLKQPLKDHDQMEFRLSTLLSKAGLDTTAKARKKSERGRLQQLAKKKIKAARGHRR